MTAVATPAPPRPDYIDDRIAWWAEHNPTGEAVTYGPRTWTWAEWNDRVRRAAAGLHDLGVGRGDVVAFLDKNHPACVEITLAAGAIGAAHAIVNWRSAPDEVEYAVNDCGAKVLFVGTDLMGSVDAVRDRLTSVEHVVEVTPDGTDGDAYEAWLARSEPYSGRPEHTSPDDVCLVMYSSGTTGRPKGVMLTHTNLVEHTLAAHDGWEFDPGDKNLVAMPLFHVGGTSYVMFGIHDGVPSVMVREPDGMSLAGAILAGANRTFLVPAVLAQVLQSGEDAIALFGNLKTFCYGAAPMPTNLLRTAIEAWPHTEFIHVYGLTEVCGVATHLMDDQHRDPGHPERLVSAGQPIPGVEVRIVDPGSLEDVPVGESGEIWLRTRQLMKGFLGKPEETAKVITADGWFRTGDIGKVDDEGYVYVHDRLKDMIITGGENVYSPEVERVLSEHPAVLECAVVGRPDDRWGESVHAVVALKPDAAATEGDLIAHCQASLAKFKCPRSVQFVEALPRNPTGKILKRELREA